MYNAPFCLRWACPVVEQRGHLSALMPVKVGSMWAVRSGGNGTEDEGEEEEGGEEAGVEGEDMEQGEEYDEEDAEHDEDVPYEEEGALLSSANEMQYVHTA